MEVLEEDENRSIVRDKGGIPKYLIKEVQVRGEEKKILEKSEKLFSQAELQSVRKEPDIELRQKVLHEYLKIKIPETKGRDALVDEIINRAMGYGKLSRLMSDPELEEVMVNGVNSPVFVFHRRYGMCSTNVVFEDKDELFRIINKLCWVHGREIAPIIDMSAIDGSRINITTDPISLHGPAITIRKQKRYFLTITQLIENGTLDLDLASLLWMSVDGMRMSPANIVIAGMIGSGKTTLLNALAMLTPPEERIITIEETPELQLSGRENWIPLATDKEHDMESLVRNTLRMRPTRIIVGEIRGSEAIALFNAMNVGRKGMGTLHSSSAREVIYRLESPPMNVPSRVVSNLDLIVIMNIFNRGKPMRRVSEVVNVGGHEGDTILLGTIYEWDPQEDKAVKGGESTISAYLDKLAERTKISKKEVMEELKKRRAVLENLIKNRIFEYNDVVAAINAFYADEI